MFEVLRSGGPSSSPPARRPLVAVSRMLFVASGSHGDPLGVAVALGASWLVIDWDAIRLPTGITGPRSRSSVAWG